MHEDVIKQHTHYREAARTSRKRRRSREKKTVKDVLKKWNITTLSNIWYSL